jgi:hypothetical protein
MLGLLGTKSLGARRIRCTGGGLTAILIPISATLLLAACQAPQHPSKLAAAASKPAAVQAETPATSESEAPVADAPETDILPKQTPLAATPAVAHGDAVMPAAVHLSGDPQELIGLDHTALRRVLGRPAQTRNETTVQVWQYVTGDCVVDLYLYDDDSGALKVTYVEARSRSAEPTPTTRCLKSLLERPTASAN